MSLWTPGGEVPVERNRQQGGEPPRKESSASAHTGVTDDHLRSLGLDPSALSAEERAQAEEVVQQLAESQRRIAEAPGAEVVANHAMGLYELAAIKLSSDPPQIEDARLAIEALRGLLETVGDELGDNSQPLQQALQSIQLAFVEVRGGPAGEA